VALHFQISIYRIDFSPMTRALIGIAAQLFGGDQQVVIFLAWAFVVMDEAFCDIR
jgi:hypothetical protein